MTDLTPAHEALLDRLADYRNRLTRAAATLARAAADEDAVPGLDPDRGRAAAKRAGVMLAYDYLRALGEGPNLDARLEKITP